MGLHLYMYRWGRGRESRARERATEREGGGERGRERERESEGGRERDQREGPYMCNNHSLIRQVTSPVTILILPVSYREPMISCGSRRWCWIRLHRLPWESSCSWPKLSLQSVGTGTLADEATGLLSAESLIHRWSRESGLESLNSKYLT